MKIVTRLSLLNNNNRKMSDYSRQENLSLFLYRNHRDTLSSLYDGDCDIINHKEYLSDYSIIIDSLAYSVSSSRRMLCEYDFIDEDKNCYG